MNPPWDWAALLIGCTGVGLLTLAGAMIALVFWQSRRIQARSQHSAGRPHDEHHSQP